MDWPTCPSCRTALSGPVDTCPDCRLHLRGRAASDYLAAAAALTKLEQRRTELLKRRDQALAGMRASTPTAVSTAGAAPAEPVRAPAHAAEAGPAAEAATTRDPAPAAEGVRGPRRDLSHRAVQNLLLLLGGVLLSIAAVVFTLVSWQVPALRALILSLFTLAVLAAPWLLVRRRLVATAETVALIGLVLIPLDGVAITQIFDDGRPSGGPGLDPLWGYSLGTAALSVMWALYAWRAPLRLPTPVAIALAQAPLPLAALAVQQGPAPALAWVAGALVATAAFDLALWRAARRARAAAEYVTTAVAGSLAWVASTGLAAYVTVANVDLPRPGMALVLGVAAAVALLWASATRARGARALIAACAALAAAGACCAVPASMVPPSWRPAVVAGAGLLVLVAALRLPVRLRDGVRTGGALVLAVTAAWKAYAVGAVAIGPLGWLTSIWRDVTGRASDLLGPGLVWHDAEATPVVMAAVVAGLALVPSRGGELWTAGLRRTLLLVSASLAVLTAPVAAGMPYEAALAVAVALAGALLWTAARSTPPKEPGPDTTSGHKRLGGGYVAPLWLGGYLAVLVACWALADREGSAAVAGGLLVALLACAVAGRPWAVQAVGGAGATLAAAMLVWALFGNGPAAALALLGVRAATLVVTRPSRRLAAAVVRARRTSRTLALGSLDRLTRLVRPGGRTAAEAAAVAVGVFALAGHSLPVEWLALLTAIAAVLAAASAWRRPRGPWRTVAAVEACVLAALAPLPLSSAVVPALVGPYGWLTHAWAGAAEGAREALSPSGPWHEQPMLLPVLVLAGAAGTFAAWARWGRPAAMGVARVAFPLAATTLPVVADLPYWAALAFLVALTAGLALWSAMSRSAVGSASLWTATLAVSWSLADRTATLAVLAAIVVTWLVCAFRGKGSPVTSVASTVAGLAVGAESVAAALGGGLGETNAALVLLLVTVLLSRAAALPNLPGAVAGPLGGAALALWPVAMVLSQDVARLTLVLAVGALALAGAAGRLRAGTRVGAYVLAGLVAGVALLPHLAVWGMALGLPYAGIGRPWSERFGGWPILARSFEARGEAFVVDPGFELSAVVTALGVGAFVAVTGVLVARGLRGALAGRAVATVVVPGCLVLVPVAGDLAYPWVLAFYGAVLVALTAQAVSGVRPGVAGVLAPVFGGHLVVWSLDVEAYTLAVLGGVAVLGAVAGVAARSETARTGAAATSAIAAGGLAAATALSAGLRVEQAAFAVLATAALTALAATRLSTLPAIALPTTALPLGPAAGRRVIRMAPKTETPVRHPTPAAAQTEADKRRPVRAATGAEADERQTLRVAMEAGADERRPVRVAVGVEVAGWGLAAAALAMAVRDPSLLSLALACTGGLALAVAALRRDRRRAAWFGLGLLQLALWLRLADVGVTAPEAYTLPLSVAGLVAAWTARRRDPGISSWSGYGPALALTFLPSAYAAWNDPALARPLLLGVAAFAATLAGAWTRLQAPLILGGGVLVVTAAHEFAPTLAELMGEGPRWLPIALAGAFLLFTGATYEHRLRDLRKIRRLIVRMR
ncbi:SCO7613 C-terminal domain-containing membrane protein [Nonomuraea sp. MTCD27]|uniref:SCO7613 C-terminal domain-containing membrane protein n=1 Tax=Nonomuraea sp. MTCD27 TaxID=1676747 RepID=UPI0035C0FB32